MKGIFYDITPTFGSSAGYREKRSHNRTICSHWAWKHIALNSGAQTMARGPHVSRKALCSGPRSNFHWKENLTL